MTLLSIDNIADRVGDHSPTLFSTTPQTRQAAVAAVLRDGPGGAHALFILRATKKGDPWSGHMAFPGGHREEMDANLRATAERETMEEIGLDLGRDARYLGQLDQVRANPRIDMVVSPFLYVLENRSPSLDPNHEVADVLWGSLRAMHSGTAHTSRDFDVAGGRQAFPGYDVNSHVVWGLTYRMIQHFFSIVDPGYVELSEI